MSEGIDGNKLPTESLYKMITIGGIVLVIAGLVGFWKSLDTSLLVNREIADAAMELKQNGAQSRQRFNSIVRDCNRLTDRIQRLQQGLPDFDNPPRPLPDVGASLAEGGESWPYFIRIPTDEFGLEDWLGKVERLRSFLEHSREYVGTTGDSAWEDELSGIEARVDELEQDAFLVKDPERKLDLSRRTAEQAEKKVWYLWNGSVILLVVGIAVFVRACVNWYNQTQRYQDAILAREASSAPIYPEVVWWKEAYPLLILIAVCALLLLLR